MDCASSLLFSNALYSRAIERTREEGGEKEVVLEKKKRRIWRGTPHPHDEGRPWRRRRGSRASSLTLLAECECSYRETYACTSINAYIRKLKGNRQCHLHRFQATRVGCTPVFIPSSASSHVQLFDQETETIGRFRASNAKTTRITSKAKKRKKERGREGGRRGPPR